MPHVITQSCCSDGSCVYACPVNCIHPSPDEPGFATAEMLHIDPAACVDCGACVSACPVDAITTDARLTAAQRPFVEINASFYPPRPPGVKLPPTSKLAPVIPAPVVRHGARPLTVAIVGSGPAAMYAADELLTQPGVRVNVFEKLPTPYGLVRAGVAPDHQSTKRVTRLFDAMTRERGFRFYLNVEVGKHLSHDELMKHHHAVLYAVGAANDRRLAVDGIGLPGVNTATEVVAWYNGHPDQAALPVDLSHERTVIIGNGNVALDVARILTTSPDTLAHTDIADHALAALRGSNIREVVIAARRGPAHSAFTLPELIGLTAKVDVVLSNADHQLVRRDLAVAADTLTRNKLEILSQLGTDEDAIVRPRIRLAYGLTPARITGSGRVDGVEFTGTDTGAAHRIEAGLVLTSIGYHGRAIRDLPFDEAAGVVPNERGRVIGAHGTYVAGWIKRGPTGFIGTNKSCALQTVQELVADYNAGVLADPAPRAAALDAQVAARRPEAVDAAGWRAIDRVEITRGDAQGRPRVKFTAVPEMLAVVAGMPKPTMRERVQARLFP
jgi:ferredoxin/flavodoxin---NADP+ reductase